MKKSERHTEILSKLRAVQKEISVDGLAREFEVAELTVRRDLTELEKQGALLRTHGGCVLTDQAVHESEYHARVSVNYKLKQAIGKKAAEQVNSGDMICINDGSTAFHLVSSLNGISPLSVYTNSIAMIDELSRHKGVEINLLGGTYNRKQHCLGGSITVQILRGLSFDTVFMGADSIDENGRILVMNPDEAEMDRIMLESGRKKILLADHTKVNADGRAVYANLSDFDLWITTRGIEDDLLKTFLSMTEVVEADGESNQ